MSSEETQPTSAEAVALPAELGAGLAKEPAWTSPPIGASEWIVGALAFGYTQFPGRNIVTDVLVFATVAVLAATYWRQRLPPRPERARGARVEAWLLGVSALSACLLLGFGLWRDAVALRWGNALLILVLYVPFAFLQQWITLRYLTQRFAGRLARGRSGRGAILGGLLFGLCHLPFPMLLVPTLFSGVAWTLAWRGGARLWTIALSHALLGGLLFLSVVERDPFRGLWALVG